MKQKSEFTVAGSHQYNQASPTRWIISHLTRYTPILLGFFALAVLANVCYALIPLLIGNAFTSVLQKQPGQLGLLALSLLLLALAQSGLELGAHYAAEVLGKFFLQADAESTEFDCSLLVNARDYKAFLIVIR